MQVVHEVDGDIDECHGLDVMQEEPGVASCVFNQTEPTSLNAAAERLPAMVVVSDDWGENERLHNFWTEG